MMRECTIADATLIAAPPTKNMDKKRNPEMHQPKKGNDWHLAMKAHIGVCAGSDLVHTPIGTAGNISDVTQAYALLQANDLAACKLSLTPVTKLIIEYSSFDAEERLPYL